MAFAFADLRCFCFSRRDGAGGRLALVQPAQ